MSIIIEDYNEERVKAYIGRSCVESCFYYSSQTYEDRQQSRNCMKNVLFFNSLDQNVKLELVANLTVKKNGVEISELSLAPGLHHLFWCSPGRSLDGVTVHVSHKRKPGFRGFLADLVIFPERGTEIETFLLANEVDSDEEGLPVPESTIGLERFGSDRVNVIKPRKQLLTTKIRLLVESLGEKLTWVDSFVPLRSRGKLETRMRIHFQEEQLGLSEDTAEESLGEREVLVLTGISTFIK